MPAARASWVIRTIESSTSRGAIIIGHAHNSDAENYSSGAAISTGEYAAMFDNPILYDDAELTWAAIENRKPRTSAADDLENAAAIDLVDNFTGEPETLESCPRKSFLLPTARENLKINPLLRDENGEIQTSPIYPSERYAAEYAPLSDYLSLSAVDLEVLKSVASEDNSPNMPTDFARRRILLDLPEKW